jgi:protein-disulfide isomerase
MSATLIPSSLISKVYPMRRPLIALICTALMSTGLALKPAFADSCAEAGGLCSVADHDAAQPVLHGELGAAIRDYLIAHPEVLLEVQRALVAKQTEERQAKAKLAVTENRAALIADPADAEIGNSQGDITIVEFFDDQCPYCKALAPALDQLVSSDHNLRIVLKEFPILGPGSDIAARYALAVKRQGKYAAFHAALMADTTPESKLAEPRLLEIAATLDLDLVRLKQDVQAPEIADQIRRDYALARTIGITGTPGLVIGDTVQSGAMPLNDLIEAIRAARARDQPK